eukprot:1425465-Pleurochrysis_carterae.AAC.1
MNIPSTVILNALKSAKMVNAFDSTKHVLGGRFVDVLCPEIISSELELQAARIQSTHNYDWFRANQVPREK